MAWMCADNSIDTIALHSTIVYKYSFNIYTIIYDAIMGSGNVVFILKDIKNA